MRWHPFVILISAVLIACGVTACAEPPAPIDPLCTVADLECPADPPFAGAPCEGALGCDYTTTIGSGHFACEDARWSGEIVCDLEGCAPILAESCRDPVASAPASVAIGPPTGSFHPYASGEMVAIQWGSQGLAMVPFRVRVGGDAPPMCASVTSTVTLDDGAPLTTSRSIALRCGQSLQILEILPELPCSMRDYRVHLDVAVDGAGAASADVVIRGGDCAFMMPG